MWIGLQQIYDWQLDVLRWEAKVATKLLTSSGWRIGSVASAIACVYTLMYFFVTELIAAVNTLWVQLPVVANTVQGALTTASNQVSVGSAGNFLQQVNYIFPLDFLVTCCCLYCTLMVTCFGIALILKAVDFVGDLPLT